MTIGSELEIARAVVALEVPRIDEEDDPPNGILVVTVKKRVVGEMVAVVKEVSVSVCWGNEAERAIVEELRGVRLFCWC